MRIPLANFAIGLIFGAGLTLSGMVNPARVQAFLDLAGAWDPSLAFVIGGALIPSAIGYALSQRMGSPLFNKRFFIPEAGALDMRLILGAVLFGIGWGLAGLCPGPALAGLVLGRWEIWLFVLAMLAGMQLQRATMARLAVKENGRTGQSVR